MIRSFTVLSLFLSQIIVANAADDWTQRFPASSPSPREALAMAYIGGDHVMVFGGYDGGYDDETWVYDLSANTWTQQSPSPHPVGRYYHFMAYIGGDQVLLFGGGDASGYPDTTWVYDLSENTWTQQSPSTHPSGREYHGMAYIGGDQVVLFGGHFGGGNRSDETWVYDLSADTWTEKNPLIHPPGLWDPAMTYIGGDHVMLFGGGAESGYTDDTWVYDLSQNVWSLQSPTTSPSARFGHRLVYIGGNQVMLFGGSDGDLVDDTWVYDFVAVEWTQDTNTTQPSARYYYGLSETSTDGSSYPVLFGGYIGSDEDDETWLFGGGDYQYPLGPMVLDIELTSPSSATLSWDEVVGATYYDLYRSTTAFFSGTGSPWLTLGPPTTQLVITDGIGDAATNYYFLGKARNATQTSPASNIVGEFDVDLP